VMCLCAGPLWGGGPHPSFGRCLPVDCCGGNDYTTGAGPLMPAEIGHIKAFYEEVAPANPEDKGIWMEIQIVWRPQLLKEPLPDDVELHDREVFLGVGDRINVHTRTIESQVTPSVSELDTNGNIQHLQTHCIFVVPK
jgi:hypothetical protein